MHINIKGCGAKMYINIKFLGGHNIYMYILNFNNVIKILSLFLFFLLDFLILFIMV
jgi:hypothetical protein